MSVHLVIFHDSIGDIVEIRRALTGINFEFNTDFVIFDRELEVEKFIEDESVEVVLFGQTYRRKHELTYSFPALLKERFPRLIIGTLFTGASDKGYDLYISRGRGVEGICEHLVDEVRKFLSRGDRPPHNID